MLKTDGSPMHTTASSFEVRIRYDMGTGDIWIQDVVADESYFNSFKKGWNFERLIDGTACSHILKGEVVRDKTLLRKLCEAKREYFEARAAV